MKTDRQNKLELDALTVGYHGRALIADIAFSLAPGEILTLIGPNGSGKTTILKSITRHLAAISGTVYIDGQNSRVLDGRAFAAKLAVVLTDRIRPELMTCRELVEAGRYPYTGHFGRLTPRDKEIVENALAAVHAEDIADRDVSEISDGQRQRILLARAICQEPEIIVLDEPTSYLDVKHKIELLEILRTMAKEKHIAVVMSLHEIDLAEKISDKIVCVKGERIAGYGTPEEIFTNETISSLFEIENGSYNALLGSIELKKPQGEPRVFVIGGGGSGVPFYRALQKKGIPFAAGIIPENDIDYPVAAALAQTVIAAKPYLPTTSEEIENAKRRIDAVPTVIDGGCPVGEYNKANGELLAYAEEHGKTVLRSVGALREATL